MAARHASSTSTSTSGSATSVPTTAPSTCSTASRSPTDPARSPSAATVDVRAAAQVRSRRGGADPTRARDATWQERFVAVIVALGEGEVVSYGDVAEDAGFPGRSRAVGRPAVEQPDRPAVVAGRAQRRPPGHPADRRPSRPAAGRGRHPPRRPRGAVPGRPLCSLRAARTQCDTSSARPSRAWHANRAGTRSLSTQRSESSARWAWRPLISTKAMRMLARASRIVAASGPRRSPSPSTRQATASIASARRREVGRVGRQVDRRQLVQPHHVVGDHDLGGGLGDPPAGGVDGRLGVGERVVGCVPAVSWRRIRRSRLLP